MGGMLGGLGGGAAGPPAVGASAPTVGRGGIVGNNLSSVVGGSPRVVGGSPPVSSLGGGMFGNLLGALFDPEGTAAKMAQAGIAPDEFANKVKQGNVASVLQPTSGAPNPANQVSNYISPSPRFSGQAPPGPAGTRPSATPQTLTPTVSQGQPFGESVVTIGDMIMKLFGGGEGGVSAPAAVPPTPGAPAAGAGQVAPLIAPTSPAPAAAPAGGVPINAPIPAPAGAIPAAVAPPVAPSPNLIPPITPWNTAMSAADYAKTGGSTLMGGAVGEPAKGLGKNPVYNDFMAGVQTKVTNPYALAVIAATGQHESSFAEKNLFRTWSDPSSSDPTLRAGGVMSWNGPRHTNMLNFVKEHGGDPDKPSARLQGEFMANEDPDLVAKLNAAKSVEEANDLMRASWKFRGWEDTKSGEGARRLATARNLVGSFGGEAGTPGAGTPGETTGAPQTKEEKAKAVAEKLASLSDALKEDTGGEDEYHGPPPPGAVPPGKGDYQVDPNVMKLMLLMLSPAGGGANIPTLTQLMSGASTAGRAG